MQVYASITTTGRRGRKKNNALFSISFIARRCVTTVLIYNVVCCNDKKKKGRLLFTKITQARKETGDTRESFVNKMTITHAAFSFLSLF